MTMKHTTLILLLAASAAAANAQTPAKPSAPAAKPASTAKPGTPAAKTAPEPSPYIAVPIKAPADLQQYKTPEKTLFTTALRYQEIEIGKGPLAEPDKLYKVHYTGYRVVDKNHAEKFDSSHDRPGPPMRDKDGKVIMGEDGKPKTEAPQPVPFPQGIGAFIIGFDQGFAGMRVGGKRRIFIPWQLGYGSRNITSHGPEHPAIPPKSDLIFDVELVEMTDMPAPQVHPGMPPGAHMMPPKPGTPGAPMPMMAPTKPAATPAPAPNAMTPAAPAATPKSAVPPAAPAANQAPAPTPAQPQSK
jgi:peptidylprolyl isomerase